MQALPPSFDAVIIGGGPVGCVAALFLAHQGARTLLLEANPHASRRFAGEWLHPPAVRVLRRLGIDLPDTASKSGTGQGFMVFPPDKTTPIILNYADDKVGIKLEHNNLVAHLRALVMDHPQVVFLSSTRLTEIEGQQLIFEQKGQSGEKRVTASLIIGAYGRSRFSGRWFPHQPHPTVLSHMAGLILENVTLPFEGFGHVVLGAPGPMLVYRLDENRVRVCVDVPLGYSSQRQAVRSLWNDYSPHLPPDLRLAFRAALTSRAPAWAANQYCPRLHYGRPGFALIGDAVGHFHPLSANGITMGFLDAECITHSPSFSSYQQERRKTSLIPELLSVALYDIFKGQTPGTRALQRATFERWRTEPAERTRMIRLLTGDDTSALHFNRSFLRILMTAGMSAAHDGLFRQQWRQTAQTTLDIGHWLRRLAVRSLPQVMGNLASPMRNLRRASVRSAYATSSEVYL